MCRARRVGSDEEDRPELVLNPVWLDKFLAATRQSPPKGQNGVTDGAEAHKQLTVLSRNSSNSRQWRFSVAPMMAWTDTLSDQLINNVLCKY